MSVKKFKALMCYVYVFLVVPFIIALMYIFPKHQRMFRHWCGKWFMALFRIKVRLEGVFEPDVQAVILNHQSYLDVIFLEAFYPGDLCWVAKKELGEPFLLGHALKAPKMILVDREDKRSLVTLFKLAKSRLEDKRILAIFPEGTRNKGEEEFLPFKNGAKLLIEKYHLRYQPIVTVNTRKFFDIGKLLVGGGEALFVAMPARDFVPTSKEHTESDWYEDLRLQMHTCYLQHYHLQNHHKGI